MVKTAVSCSKLTLLCGHAYMSSQVCVIENLGYINN